MSWIRLDVAAFQDRALRRAGMHGRLVFMAAVMLSKLRDWAVGDLRGWLPRKEFDGLEVALHWGDATDPENVAKYDAAIAALAAGPDPLLTPETDGSGWWIAGWKKYQPDPSALARKRKERAERWKAAKDGDGQPEDVTVCHSDKRDKASAGSGGKREKLRIVARHRDDRDVTLRDETRRDEYETKTSTSTSHVSSEEGRGAAPSPARPGAEAVAALKEGIAVRDAYVPGSLGDPTGLPDPAAKAREVIAAMGRAPKTPIRGPDPPPPEAPPKIADAGRIEKLKAETLARIAELEAKETA